MKKNPPLIHTFAHEAMDSVFTILISGDDADYAQQATTSAFEELNALERHLSRFNKNSDISQINNLSAGESAVVDPTTFECLRISAVMGAETGGAFDIAFRSRTIRSQNSLFELNPKTLSVKSFHGNLKLDLGGIGKGFALDKMAELLSEWDIRSAMLRSATSTILSTMPPPGATGWEVEFGPSDTHQTLFLKNNAFSGSSVEFRGKHVINPHYGTPGEKSGAWALASTGARADALSTAFMIMSSDEIREYISKHPGVSAWIKSANGKIAMHT